MDRCIVAAFESPVAGTSWSVIVVKQSRTFPIRKSIISLNSKSYIEGITVSQAAPECKGKRLKV